MIDIEKPLTREAIEMWKPHSGRMVVSLFNDTEC